VFLRQHLSYISNFLNRNNYSNFPLSFQIFQLTPEDEDRRRRRRERNKIAATKCRMKKRERTVNLVHESEVLETQNIDLKAQVRDLEAQRRKLLDVLQSHGANCVHQGGYQPLPSLSTLRACKYLADLSDQRQPTNEDEPTEIKYSQVLKEAAQHHTPQSQQPLPNANHILPGYCKPSPTSEIGYVMSPDSGFVKSPAELDVNGGVGYKDYIPNCDTTSTQDREFLLKNELIDSSPFATVQSGDRFLFENSENMDRLTPSTAASIKDHILHNQHQQQLQQQHQHLHQSHQPTPHNHHLEYSANFDGTLLSKADFLSQHTEYLCEVGDGVESQFTDLDSGVTTYSNMNGGCLA
jgi:activating transcription factor 3